MKKQTLFWLLLGFIIISSVYFRVRIIHELPLGTSTTTYGLIGFDDEPAHLNYTNYLLKHQKIPVLKRSITTEDAFEVNEFEYHQPPLYYTVIAGISDTFNIRSQRGILLTGRYFSLICFLLSLAVIWAIFSELGWHKFKIISAMAVFALLGSSVYQFTLFGNDGLSWLIMWIIFLLVMKGLEKNWLYLILFLTFAHYTKSSIIVYYPLIAWAVIKEVKKTEVSAKNIKLTAVIIVPLLCALPWYIRNHLVYGHFFSVSTITGDKWFFVTSLKESLTEILRMPYSLFYRMHFDPPKTQLSWFNIVHYLWLIYALIYWFLKALKELKQDYKFQQVSILGGSMIIAFLYFAVPTGYTEARLLFPALPAILYILTDSIYFTKFDRKNRGYINTLIILILLFPSYIIGFDLL